MDQSAVAVEHGEAGHQNPPRHGEGDRDAKRRGGGAPRQGNPVPRAPSTMLRMVPLPVPGRILDR
ncbi:MAG: hypothetical protein B7Y97_11130 [Sphingomonas sp. 32-66-10]|nr:MAG: hypothetical protein B7Y97_11130 [Sphingomonas sp. 32-66-10]